MQALWQLAKELKAQIWSLENIVALAVEGIQDAKAMVEQLFHYEPQMVKQEARTEAQNPTTEPYLGQYVLHANWLLSFKQRECVIRRYYNEDVQDRNILAKFPNASIY